MNIFLIGIKKYGTKLFQMILHGYDHSSLVSHLDAKCLPTKYGGLVDIDTEHGIDLWNLLCYYEENYKGKFIFIYLNKQKHKF